MSKKISVWESYKEQVRKNKLVFLTCIFGPLLFLLFVLWSGDNNSGSNSQTYNFSSKRIVCTGGGCVIKCSYSGSRLDAWTKWYDDGYHVRLPRWGCPLRIDQDGYPAR